MSAYQNPFVHDRDHYKRDLNLMGNYVEQQAAFVAKMRDISLDEAREFVKWTISEQGPRPFRDRIATHTERDKHGDRFKTQSGLFYLINRAIERHDIIAPTLTTYYHPKVLESPLVASIDGNVAKRSVNKKAMFQAEKEGNWNVYIAKNQEQTGNKLSNNALSGAHVSNGTPLTNPSAHSSLTSTCRITSGYGNANNEKIIAGNRHYYSAELVINNFTSIITNTDFDQLQRCMDTYGLVPPTRDDVMGMVNRCTRRYWKDSNGMALIESVVNTFNALELAAVMYTGDMFSLKQINDGPIRQMITRMITRATTPHPDPDTVFKNAADDFTGLAMQLHAGWMREYQELKNIKEQDPVKYGIIANTLDGVYQGLAQYDLFIKTFFASSNLPASLAYFPSSIRDSAVVSDTDSTIFTVQDWVKWYTGDYGFDETSCAVSDFMVFFTSQSITHALAMMSANLGVEKKRLFQIAMKNEFKFDVLVPTLQSKHYYAAISRKETKFYEKHKLETKGVHLKSSSAPKSIMDMAADKMYSITMDVIAGKKFNMHSELTFIADTERKILDSIKRGDHDYYRFLQIKSADSYTKGPSQSNYQHFTMWQDVFAPKYGMSEDPPYTALKVNSKINSEKEFRGWIDELDSPMKENMSSWIERNDKAIVRTFYVPQAIASARGIPDEIFKTMDTRRVLLDNSSVFYKIAETLGVFMLDKKINRLASDMY